MFRKSIGLASAAVLALGVGASAAVPAQAGPSAATATCTIRLGSVTSAGTYTSRTITASTPITVGAARSTAGAFGANQVQHISTFTTTRLNSSESQAGLTVMGNALYASSFVVDQQGRFDPQYPHTNRRIGGGWGAFRWIDQSILWPTDSGNPARVLLYAQRTDGTTDRWLSEAGSWRMTSSVGGLTRIKGISVIGRTATSETLLANTRDGALVAIKWPTRTFGVPTAAVVRGSTWQGFEQLLATKCGLSGTLLLGIDRDTQSGYLYAVGHLNGSATVIRGLGKVPLTFSDAKYFRIAPKYEVLNGG